MLISDKTRVLSYLCLVVFGVLLTRMVCLSIPSGKKPATQNIITSDRGNIYDRNGNILATNVKAYNLYVNPSKTVYPEKTISVILNIFPDLKFAKEFGIISEKLKNRDLNGWVLIKKNILEHEKQQIVDHGLEGAFFETSTFRYYPHGNLFSHIVGYTNSDMSGSAGIEKYLNKKLTSPTENDINIALDARIQNITRSAITEQISEFSAKGGFGIVANMNTGEILASVSLPDFDPNSQINPTSESMRNVIASSAMDLGSVFKIFTVAMGVESGIKKDDSFNVSKPVFVESGFSITDEHGAHASMTTSEVLAFSSNVGTALILEKIGLERQKKFMEDFGLFGSIKIELPAGEVALPIYKSGKWPKSMHYTASYGYGVSVSPLKFLEIASGVVNDGIVRPLTLLKNTDDNAVNGRQIVAKSTSIEMQTMLREVVASGTARRATVNGYTVCGKTGTSEKYNFKARMWEHDKKITSFFAFFPCNNPQYAIYVGIDEPRKTSKMPVLQGGTVAAPVVGHIIEKIGPILNVRPDATIDVKSADTKDIITKTTDNKPDSTGTNPAGASNANAHAKNESPTKTATQMVMPQPQPDIVEND